MRLSCDAPVPQIAIARCDGRDHEICESDVCGVVHQGHLEWPDDEYHHVKDDAHGKPGKADQEAFSKIVALLDREILAQKIDDGKKHSPDDDNNRHYGLKERAVGSTQRKDQS